MEETQHDNHLWTKTFAFGFALYGVLGLYLFLREGVYDLAIANKAFASEAMILIGLSFALSGICYFFNFADTKIAYRKHLGVLGFSLAATHGIISLFFLPNLFPFPQYYATYFASFLFAIAALMILTVMAAVSNTIAIRALGGPLWREILRTGYVAYILSMLHFGMKSKHIWLRWIADKHPLLPPLSLLVFLFAVGVLILRVLLEVSLRRKKISISDELTNRPTDLPNSASLSQ
jgi:DMSO/TMAO reductase YedYZ heme-binding membrane subunit